MQPVARCQVSPRVDAQQHCTRPLGAFLAQQEAYRLRQLPVDQGQQKQRHHSGKEHRFPAKTRQDENAHAGRQHPPQRVAAEHDGNHCGADLLRRVLVHQRHHVRHQPTAPQACKEAAYPELGGGAGQPVDQGGATEQQTAHSDPLLATDLVGQGAEAHGTKHHAKERVTTQRPGFQRRQPPLLHQHRQDSTVDEQIVSVEDQQQKAPTHHHPVETADPCIVDDAVNIHVSHDIGLLLLLSLITKRLPSMREGALISRSRHDNSI
ncbi:hypothetical protein D3C76_920870 [compost metagenome]